MSGSGKAKAGATSEDVVLRQSKYKIESFIPLLKFQFVPNEESAASYDFENPKRLVEVITRTVGAKIKNIMAIIPTATNLKALLSGLDVDSKVFANKILRMEGKIAILPEGTNKEKMNSLVKDYKSLRNYIEPSSEFLRTNLTGNGFALKEDSDKGMKSLVRAVSLKMVDSAITNIDRQVADVRSRSGFKGRG